MQDLKKNKRKINQVTFQNEFNKDLNEELQEDSARGCKSKEYNYNKHNNDCECDCECKPKNNNKHCEPCEVEADECVDNKCNQENYGPISVSKSSTANSMPLAIEVNRIFDSIKFQLFTEASAPNGEDLYFEYEVTSVDGPIPRSGVVNINIEKVCMNYSDVVIKPGCTNLEDRIVREIKECKKEACNQNLCPDFENNVDSEFCKTYFEYNVCGNKNANNSSQGEAERAVYKEKGLKVVVKDLVLELKGKCGCTKVTVLAYPAMMNHNGDLELVDRVVFNFNTLTAPLSVPVNGKEFTLRQNFQTALNVDCIGKTLLRLVDDDCCGCCYDFCIPNGIDLILCLEEVVSILVNEQIVVMAYPNAVDPRVVDTFAKVCDFTNNTDDNNRKGCNCNR